METETEWVIIPKELLGSDCDQELYLCKSIKYHTRLKLLFYYKEYFVYHVNFGFNIIPFKNIVIEYITNNFKVNDMGKTIG